MISDRVKTQATQFASRIATSASRDGWEQWQPQEGDLGSLMRATLVNLEAAMLTRDQASVAVLTAQLAAYAMKAQEIFGKPL